VSVTNATLHGARIDAELAMPGADWLRLGSDGIRRQDQRLTFATADGAVILVSYDNALIRESEAFLDALAHGGGETTSEEQYMRMVAQFDIGEGRVAGDHQIEYMIHRLD